MLVLVLLSDLLAFSKERTCSTFPRKTAKKNCSFSGLEEAVGGSFKNARNSMVVGLFLLVDSDVAVCVCLEIDASE